MKMTQTILVDMDSVLADYNKKKYEIMVERGYPEYQKPEDQTHFYGRDTPGYSDEIKAMSLGKEAGFFESLEPIEGGLEALKEMLELGFNVRICTAPYITNPTGFQAKADWVEKHLGIDWVARTIMTNDKSLAKGDFLIDDKPFSMMKNSLTPEWKHLVFEQKYNEGTAPKGDYINWKNWKEVLRNHGVDI